MYQDNLSPNRDQSARAEATLFNNDPEADTQIDLHASELDLDLIRKSIAQVTQLERVPTREELLLREAMEATRKVRTNRRIYDGDHFDLENDEQPTQDMFGTAA